MGKVLLFTGFRLLSYAGEIFRYNFYSRTPEDTGRAALAHGIINRLTQRLADFPGTVCSHENFPEGLSHHREG